MGQYNSAYIKLQKHLDNQALGFPATRSGAELKVLKHIFTPEEVEIACCMSHKFEPLESIYSRANGRVGSSAELEQVLNRIQDKGGRVIDRNEALEIIDLNQRDGLVLQPSNTQKAEFICSCCGCC